MQTGTVGMSSGDGQKSDKVTSRSAGGGKRQSGSWPRGRLDDWQSIAMLLFNCANVKILYVFKVAIDFVWSGVGA